MTTAVFAPDHPITVHVVDKATGEIVDTSTTTAELIGGHYTVTCIMWNALSNSGGIRWRHPATGKLYPGGLSIRCETTHPDTGEPVGINW